MAMKKSDLDTKAWLHKKDGRCWEFVVNKQMAGLYTTKRAPEQFMQFLKALKSASRFG